jgi:hypothetical protein
VVAGVGADDLVGGAMWIDRGGERLQQLGLERVLEGALVGRPSGLMNAAKDA